MLCTDMPYHLVVTATSLVNLFVEHKKNVTGKSALVLFYHVNSCVQYDALVIWPLHLTFVYLYLIAFTPHALTYVTITSLSNHNNAHLPELMSL